MCAVAVDERGLVRLAKGPGLGLGRGLGLGLEVWVVEVVVKVSVVVMEVMGDVDGCVEGGRVVVEGWAEGGADV